MDKKELFSNYIYKNGWTPIYEGTFEKAVAIQIAWKLLGVDTDKIYDGKQSIVRPLSINDHILACQILDEIGCKMLVPKYFENSEFIDYNHTFIDGED